MMSEQRKQRVKHFLFLVFGFVSSKTMLNFILGLQMNYQFLKSCVAQAPIVTMQDSSKNSILSMIPSKCKEGRGKRERIENLFSEVISEYEDSMKKATSKLFECDMQFHWSYSRHFIRLRKYSLSLVFQILPCSHFILKR